MWILLITIIVGLAVLAYQESPAYESDRQMSRLLKESKKKEKEREHNRRRGYKYAQIGCKP